MKLNSYNGLLYNIIYNWFGISRKQHKLSCKHFNTYK